MRKSDKPLGHLFCGIVLAGGKSTRMGENKAFLEWNGKSFIELQIEKLRALNVAEILISGPASALSSVCEHVCSDTQVRIIPDIIENRGPLGGLYSCFCNTKCRSAIVISADTPLLSVETLRRICLHHAQHDKDATVLTAASYIEPLIAAYQTDVYPTIKTLIDKDSLSMRSLLDSVRTQYLPFDGDPSELYNCNTKEDYQKLLSSH